MAQSDRLVWGSASATVSVGETIVVPASYGMAPTSAGIEQYLNGHATVVINGGGVEFTGVSAGTSTIPAGSPVGDYASTENAFTLTVTAPADDQNFLNERGLAHFWDNIDSAKQDKLTAGSNITISNGTISATQPTVNDATLTIAQNGTSIGTFTANQSTNATANITVPTATSDLTNDGASGSSAYVEADELATVATTGAYGDLTGTPTIPTVNNATLTIQKNGSNVQTFTANQSTNATANITVPTKTSELTNNSGFLTSVATANIADRAVTTAKLASGIVTMTRTVLYNNASGTTGNITVSQALNKFDEVEFWFMDSNGTPSQLIRTIPGDALAIVLDIPHPGGSNTVYWNLARWYWTAGSTTLTKWGSHYEKVLSTTVSTAAADHIKIRKIVGIKFVSN